MTQEEFNNRLKEGKIIDDFIEHSNTNYEVVKYYIEHYVNLTVNGVKLTCAPPENDEQRRLINFAFNQIREKLGYK